MPNMNGHRIDHVVVLMLENRGFDHFMGYLYSQQDLPLHWYPQRAYNVNWWGQQEAIPDFNGLDWVQNPATLENPYVERERTVFRQGPIRGARSPIVPSVDPHEDFVHIFAQMYNVDAAAMATAASRNRIVRDHNDHYTKAPQTGYVQDFAHEVHHQLKSKIPFRQIPGFQQIIREIMEIYTPDQIPVLAGLARHYALSDLWFCSVPSQTNMNRAFWMSGSSRGLVTNDFYDAYPHLLERNRTASDALPIDSYSLFEMLSQFDVDWRYYWQEPWPPLQTSAPLTSQRQYARTMFPALRDRRYDDNFERIDAFFTAAANGRLPPVSYIEPHFGGGPTWGANMRIQGNEYHPVADVTTPEFFVWKVYSALTSDALAWSRTLFVITFDENGGTYDHYPPPPAIPPGPMFDRVPPAASAETPNSFLAQKDFSAAQLATMSATTRTQFGFPFDLYGIRVPTLLISPWVQRGTIFRSPTDVPFDHTSILATILKWQGLERYAGWLGSRVAHAPTFDLVLDAPQVRAPNDAQEGIALHRAVPPARALRVGDRFVLRYSGTNRQQPYRGPAFVGGPSVWGSVLGRGGWWYPITVGVAGEAMVLRLLGATDPVVNGARVQIVVDSSQAAPTSAGRVLSGPGQNQPTGEAIWLADGNGTPTWWRIWLRDNRTPGEPIGLGDEVMFVNDEYLPENLVKPVGVFLWDPYKRLGLEDSDQPTYFSMRSGEWAFFRLTAPPP